MPGAAPDCLVIKEGRRLLYGFQEEDVRRQVCQVDTAGDDETAQIILLNLIKS